MQTIIRNRRASNEHVCIWQIGNHGTTHYPAVGDCMAARMDELA